MTERRASESVNGRNGFGSQGERKKLGIDAACIWPPPRTRERKTLDGLARAGGRGGQRERSKNPFLTIREADDGVIRKVETNIKVISQQVTPWMGRAKTHGVSILAV